MRQARIGKGILPQHLHVSPGGYFIRNVLQSRPIFALISFLRSEKAYDKRFVFIPFISILKFCTPNTSHGRKSGAGWQPKAFAFAACLTCATM